MGHCVYGADDHEWWYIHAIAPRQCQSGNVMVKPYGTLKMDYATTTQGHKENNYDNFDIAVIKLLPNMGNRSELLYPSDVVGYVGLHQLQSFERVKLNKAAIMGCPDDTANGEMWTSGPCPDHGNGISWFHAIDITIVTHMVTCPVL